MREHKKKNFVQIIYTHINNNAKEYFAVIIVLLIGIVIGVMALNNSNDNQREEIRNYINQFISSISENQNINRFELFKNIIISNFIFIIAFIFVGSTVIGVPIVYAFVAYKGFCFSYSVSAIIAILGNNKGLIFAIFAIFLQNLIYIPCILALAVSGIRLYKTIIKDKRRDNIKLEILRHIIFSSIIGIVFLIGSFIEAYASTNLIIMYSKFL